MKKAIFTAIVLVFAGVAVQAQRLTAADARTLRQKQDTLKFLAEMLITADFPAQRLRSDSLFIKTLIRSLQVKNSFYFPFDSVKGISKLYAPDSSFRIFTWELNLENFSPMQRGAIQYRTPDGSMKLSPLRDFSERTEAPLDSVRGSQNWIGAVYYDMVKTSYNGKSFYTLFGFDGYGPRSTRKWIEVLSFDKDNNPVFGGRLFSFANDTPRKRDQYRYNIEYKKEASTTVRFDPEYKVILFDHLISESDQPDLPWTLIPDGDYEAFKWEGGKWLHINKFFNEKLQEGQVPMPAPIRDGKGNLLPPKKKEQQ